MLGIQEQRRKTGSRGVGLGGDPVLVGGKWMNKYGLDP